MKIERIGDNITEIEGRVRIEPGPPRRVVVATEEALAPGGELSALRYRLGGRDAMGNWIEIGKECAIVDRLCGTVVHYVYRRQAGRWMPVGAHATYEAALTQATEAAAEGEV